MKKNIVSLLAGGKSSRMKENKLFLRIQDTPLIRKQIDKILNAAYAVHVICSKENFLLLEKEQILPRTPYLKTFVDLIPDSGPLGGIYTALYYAQQATVVIAGDLPYLNPQLLDLLFLSIKKYDAVIPVTVKGFEPLLACYALNCFSLIKKHIDQQNYKVSSIFSKLNIHWLSEDLIKKIDPEMQSFININTRADAERWLT